MKEGKMVCITEGKEIPIETEITMKNGMKCMPDGTCIGKDGTKIMLKEGYCCDINGKVFLMPIKDDQPKEIKLETVPN